MKRLVIEISILVILIAVIGAFFHLWKSERTERIRTESNQHALLTKINHYRTSDSLNAVSIEQLTLTKKELQEHRADLTDRLEKQGIKIKRLESFISLSTETNIQFVPVRKDSTIYVPGKDSVIHLKCLEYKDNWTDFKGCYDENNIPRVSLVVHDSINITGHVVPKNIWFIKFGVKAVRAEITNINPYARIKHAEFIKMKR